MSDHKHTPTPWSIDSNPDSRFQYIYGGSEDDRRKVAKCESGLMHNYGENRANAEHIIKCVNLLAGMPDPAAEIARLRSQDMRFSQREPTALRYQLEQSEARYNALLQTVAGGIGCQPMPPMILQGADAQKMLENFTIDVLTAERDRLREVNGEMAKALQLLLNYSEDVQDEGPRGYGWKSSALSSVIATAESLIAKHSAIAQNTEKKG